MNALVGFEFEFAAPVELVDQISESLSRATGRPVIWDETTRRGDHFIALGQDVSARLRSVDGPAFEGLEIRTPPLPPAEAFDLARRIAAWVRDHPDLARTHAATGVHVTIDADDPYLLAGLLLLRHFTPAPDRGPREQWADPDAWDAFVECVVYRVTHYQETASDILLACAENFDTKYAALHRRHEGLWELRWPGGEGWENRIESVVRQITSILRRSAMAARYGLRAIEAALRATARRHGVPFRLPRLSGRRIDDAHTLLTWLERIRDPCAVLALPMYARIHPVAFRDEGVLQHFAQALDDCPVISDHRTLESLLRSLHGAGEDVVRAFVRLLRTVRSQTALQTLSRFVEVAPPEIVPVILHAAWDRGLFIGALALHAAERHPNLRGDIARMLLDFLERRRAGARSVRFSNVRALVQIAPRRLAPRIRELVADTVHRLLQRAHERGASAAAQELADLAADRLGIRLDAGPRGDDPSTAGSTAGHPERPVRSR